MISSNCPNDILSGSLEPFILAFMAAVRALKCASAVPLNAASDEEVVVLLPAESQMVSVQISSLWKGG